MRRSQLFMKTMKDAPSDEVARNAQLLIRAGYVYKVIAGAYAYTPLGIRVIENIKRIVREEMNAIGGQELIMTALQRPETWQGTGRWDDDVVDVWFKTQLNDESPLGLAWSHEEAIIEMMKPHITSYKDLPQYVYQFQTKFRNELRSKSGIMRGREFVMKDMYSCTLDADQHETFYQECIKAYNRVFDRLGLGDDTYVTFADGGAFTKFSHEFQTICDAGEDEIFLDESTGDYLNREVVVSKVGVANADEPHQEYEEHKLGKVTGVQALIEHFGIPIEKSTKALYFDTENNDTILAVTRSDYSVDTKKLGSLVGSTRLTLTSEEKVREITGSEPGFAGLINMPNVEVYMDDSLEGLCNFETGCNKTGYHAINVNFGRDVTLPEKFVDIKQAKKGDINPKTGKAYLVSKAAEVGNIFNFGTQKSEDMDFGFTDSEGNRQYVHLGSYGIGISRAMGVIAEKFADDKGLVWPVQVAPAQVYMVTIGGVTKQAEQLYADLEKAGIGVLFDDRDVRPGEKFADAELMGIPYRVVISDRTLAEDSVELKIRADNSEKIVKVSDIVHTLEKIAQKG